MEVGLVVLNERGAVQFDTSAFVMGLVGAPEYANGIYPDQLSGPLYAIRPTMDGRYLRYTFEKPVDFPSYFAPWGILLRDGAGRLTFNSSQPPMRIVDTVFVGGSPEGGSTFWSGTPGRLYAIVFPSWMGGSGWRQTHLIYQPGPGENPDGPGGPTVEEPGGGGQGGPIYTDEIWYEPCQWQITPRLYDAPHLIGFDCDVQGTGPGWGTTQNPPGDQTVTGTALIVDVTDYD